MIKKLLFGFVLLISLVSSYSYTNISSCGIFLASNQEYKFNDTIYSNSSSSCININSGNTNISIDCQGNKLISNQSTGFTSIFSVSDILIENCYLENTRESFRIRGSSTNITLSNVTIVNNDGRAIYLEDAQNSYFSNITIINTSEAFTALSDFSNNNTFKDISIYNSTIGIFLSGSNNRYDNLNIVNTTVPITVSTPSNSFITIENSRLGNTSTWTNINNLNISSTLFRNNFYENFNGTSPFCIYQSVCDTLPNNVNPNINTNKFPSQGFISTLISFSILFLFFL